VDVQVYLMIQRHGKPFERLHLRSPKSIGMETLNHALHASATLFSRTISP